MRSIGGRTGQAQVVGWVPSLDKTDYTVGNESVPIQLAQCWFRDGLTISSAKI